MKVNSSFEPCQVPVESKLRYTLKKVMKVSLKSIHLHFIQFPCDLERAINRLMQSFVMQSSSADEDHSSAS